MKKIFLLFVLFSFSAFGQNDTLNLLLDLPLLQMPFLNDAAIAVEARNYSSLQNVKPNYFKAYANLSMQQNLALSASFYNSLFRLYSVSKFNFFESPYANMFTKNLVFSMVFLFSEYLPLGDSWLHEEFHRSVLTKVHINSYDQVYDFPLFSSVIVVNNVLDDELESFKSSNPVDFVRLHSAGIEGELLLTKELQFRSFFLNQDYPYFYAELSWITNLISYVWICHTDQADIITDEANNEDGSSILKRDFTGLDFTAWVYDLFKPFEPYYYRGIHPSGIGIDRYIKKSDLTIDELKYLKRQSYWELANLISPFLIGKNYFDTKYGRINFAVRYYLTSFGSDMNFDFFLKNKKYNNYLFGLHFYSNKNLILPGANLFLYRHKLFNTDILFSSDLSVWIQPENLLFVDNKVMLGGSFDASLDYGFGKIFPYLAFGYKTKGWKAGIVNQNRGSYFRFGIRINL